MKRLDTSRLSVLKTDRVKTLEAKAGTTPRTRGRAWQKKRHDVMIRDGFSCATCGALSLRHEVDHKVPLEQGGSDMDDANLQLLCTACHGEKTSREASVRAAGGGGG